MLQRIRYYRRVAAAALVLASMSVIGCKAPSVPVEPPPSSTSTPPPTPAFHYRLVDNLCEYVSPGEALGSLPYVVKSLFPDPVPLGGIGCTVDLDRSDGKDAWALIFIRLHTFGTVGEAEEAFTDLRNNDQSELLFADVDGIGQAATRRLGYLGGTAVVTVLDGNAVITGEFAASGALPAGTIAALTETIRSTLANLQNTDPTPPRSSTPPPPVSTATYALPDNLCDYARTDALSRVLPIVAVNLEKSDSPVASARVCVVNIGFTEDFFYGGTFGLAMELFASETAASERFSEQLEANQHDPQRIRLPGLQAYQYIFSDIVDAGIVKILDTNAVFTGWWTDAQGREPSDEAFEALADTVRTTMSLLRQPH